MKLDNELLRKIKRKNTLLSFIMFIALTAFYR